MNHAKWIDHFERNCQHRPEPDWSQPVNLSRRAWKHLTRSLVEYQLGDGGGPACLIARDAEQFRGSSEPMRQIVDLWFAEEREHSRLLGCAVDRLGGVRIHAHWSFSAFLACRQAIGVRAELQVLLLVEIVSSVYYRLIQRHCADAPVRDMCALILRDEAGHIAFHRDRLASAGVSNWGVGGRLWEMQFRLFGVTAAVMLWLNHGRMLRMLGAGRIEFWLEVHRELSRFIVKLSSTAAKGICPPLQPVTAVNQA